MQRGFVPIEELLRHEDPQVRHLAQLFQSDPRVNEQIRRDGLPREVVELMHSGVTAEQVSEVSRWCL